MDERCTTMSMFLVPLNRTNMFKIVCFVLCGFYHNKRKNVLKNVSSWGLPWWSNASNAEGAGSIPGRETKFLQAAQPKKQTKKCQLSGRIESVLCILRFHRFNQQRIENIQVKKKIPESSRKQNFCCTRNYLHSIYIIFTTIYITFIPY